MSTNRWDKLGSPDIILVRINDTSLVITEDMIGFNVWNCTAENTVLDNTTQLLQRITFHACMYFLTINKDLNPKSDVFFISM